MNPSEEYKELAEIYFCELRELYSDSSKKAMNLLKSDFMKSQFREFKKMSLDEDIQCKFILNLFNCLKDVKFFVDGELKNALKEYDIKKPFKKSFISIDNIKKEIDTINQKGNFYINPYYSILILEKHLEITLLDDIINNYSLVTNRKSNGDTMQNIVGAMFKAEKQSITRFVKFKKDENMSPFQKLFKSKIIDELEGLLSNLSNDEKTKLKLKGDAYKTIQLIFNGKSNPRELIINSRLIADIKKGTKEIIYFDFHPLVKILIPDMTEEKKVSYSIPTLADGRYLRTYFYNDILKNKLNIFI